VDALKVTDKKLSKKMLWNKEKKHGLEFNPGLVLIALRTTGHCRGVTFLSYFSLDWIREISQFLVSLINRKNT